MARDAAHRRAVDRVRREEASRRRADAMASQPPVAPPDLDEAMSTLWIGERVRSAVQELPEEQRACVNLAYFEGKTYIEVAEILGIPEGTAKSRMASRCASGGHPERRHLVGGERRAGSSAALALDALEADEAKTSSHCSADRWRRPNGAGSGGMAPGRSLPRPAAPTASPSADAARSGELPASVSILIRPRRSTRSTSSAGESSRASPRSRRSRPRTGPLPS